MAKNSKAELEKNTKVALIAQELKQARILAGNDKKLRDRTLKKLRKWLTFRSQSSTPFTEADFMRLWKGLFYCMWMSDKPLIQEECAEMISQLVHCFSNGYQALLFYKCFLQTMCNEWFGIDIFRLDKFYMLVRRMLRQILHVIKKNNWDSELVNQFGSVVSKTVLNKSIQNILGLTLHFVEIFLEELAKVSKGKLQNLSTTEFLKPFVKALAVSTDRRVTDHINTFVFKQLLHQSDAGIEYQEKFEAWKNRGFVGGTINSLQKVAVNESDSGESDDEDFENGNKDKSNDEPEDPRAGRVDVVLPQIPFDSKQIADLLLQIKYEKDTTTKSRKIIQYIIDNYNKMAEGVFPLGIKRLKLPSEKDTIRTKIDESAEKLVKFEENLYDRVIAVKKLPKSEKRKLKRLREENVDEEEISKILKSKHPKTEQEDIENDTKSEFEKFVEASEGGIDLKLFNNDNAKKIKNKHNKKVETAKQKIKFNTNKVEMVKSVKNSKRKHILENENINITEKSKRKKVIKQENDSNDLSNGDSTFIGLAPTSGVWVVQDIDESIEKTSTTEKSSSSEQNSTDSINDTNSCVAVNTLVNKPKKKKSKGYINSITMENIKKVIPKRKKNLLEKSKTQTKANNGAKSTTLNKVKKESVEHTDSTEMKKKKIKVNSPKGKKNTTKGENINDVLNETKSNIGSSQIENLAIKQKMKKSNELKNNTVMENKCSDSKTNKTVVLKEKNLPSDKTKGHKKVSVNNLLETNQCLKTVKVNATQIMSESKLKLRNPFNLSKTTDKDCKSSNLEEPTTIANSLRSKRSLFPETEWNVPPQDGEIELFIPSKKTKLQIKEKAKSDNKTVNDILDEVNKKVLKRTKLDNQSVVLNPFSKSPKTPTNEIINTLSENSSSKKVKIVLKHNTAQEKSEYYRQVKSSPALPFDANKKPTKSLLKSNVPSPVNPFYKLRSSLG